MQISGVLSDFFYKIAEKLGKKTQTKQYIENDFYDVEDISLTAVLADRLATLIVADSDVEVTGSSKAKVLQDVAQEIFKIKLKPSVMTSLGTGDCLIVPVTNGKLFDIDIIENNKFVVYDSIGDRILSCSMERDSFVKNNNTYKRFEYHGIEDRNGTSYCVIKRYATVNSKEVPLHSISEWANIPELTEIPNVDRLLFGRFKCPTINRDNINSVQGVPITYGLDKAVEKAKESYVRFNSEFENKETMLFAGKQLFAKDENKNVVLPRKGVFQLVKSDLDGNLPIKEYSPDLRYNDLRGGVEFNFKMLELFCGLSNGVLTDIQGVDLATATAIRSSMHSTFAFVNTMRKIIENGMDDLIYGISMLFNANSQSGVIGSYSVKYSWDDSLMENSMETYNQLLQSQGIGVVSKAEMRSWQMNEPIEVAEQRIKEIQQEENDSDFNEDEPTTTPTQPMMNIDEQTTE